MKKSLDVIKNTKLIYGTDWRSPVKMALEMNPTPQLIFFMTDGASGGNMAKIVDDLAKMAKKKGTVINTISLMEPNAERFMLELANQTGGVFTIVNEDGTSKEVKK